MAWCASSGWFKNVKEDRAGAVSGVPASTLQQASHPRLLENRRCAQALQSNRHVTSLHPKKGPCFPNSWGVLKVLPNNLRPRSVSHQTSLEWNVPPLF